MKQNYFLDNWIFTKDRDTLVKDSSERHQGRALKVKAVSSECNTSRDSIGEMVRGQQNKNVHSDRSIARSFNLFSFRFFFVASTDAHTSEIAPSRSRAPTRSPFFPLGSIFLFLFFFCLLLEVSSFARFVNPEAPLQRGNRKRRRKITGPNFTAHVEIVRSVARSKLRLFFLLFLSFLVSQIMQTTR